MINGVFGGKVMVAKQVGIFAQGKFCFNSSDSFFFENDIIANAGIAVALQ